MAERLTVAQLEAKLAAQLAKDRAKPANYVRTEANGIIVVRPSNRACGLVIAIAALTGEDDDDILARVGFVALEDKPPETAIVITVPDTGLLNPTQVLVRLPGHIDADNVAVDFRPAPQASWSPAEVFGRNNVDVRHQ